MGAIRNYEGIIETQLAFSHLPVHLGRTIRKYYGYYWKFDLQFGAGVYKIGKKEEQVGEAVREPFGHCAKYAVLFYSPFRRFQLAQGFCRRAPQDLPCDLLQEIKARYGIGALLMADVILFGWCFIFTLFLDLFSGRMLLVSGILGFLSCEAAFSLCGEERARSLVKFCYLAWVFFSRGSWLIAACFMLLLEHITMEMKKNGGDAA